MSSPAGRSGFIVFLLLIPVFQGQVVWRVTYSPPHICALEGSTVDISCTYTYPSTGNNRVQEILWFTKGSNTGAVDLRTDSDYTGRVQYFYKPNSSSVRIRDLRKSDSAEYKFSFITNSGRFTGSPGVTLSVTDPDLQILQRRSPVFSSSNTWATLECHSRCRLPADSSYFWYKNGQKILYQTSSTYSAYLYPADSFSCALQGHEFFPSPPVCVQGQTCNRVMYNSRTICAAKGSSVDISCVYNSHEDRVESKLWFRPDGVHQRHHSQPDDFRGDSQSAGRVEVFEAETGSSTLRIRNLTDADSAQYHFKFTTPSFEWKSSLPGTTLTVTALQVSVTRVSVHQSHTEAELKCHSSCSPAASVSYVWFKNGEKVRKEDSSYEDRFNPGDVISCALKGHEDYGSPPLYALNVPSVSVSPSADIMEGSSVNLTCSSDANSAANYTWNKNKQTLVNKKQQLVFSSIQASDSGEYYCTAENQLGQRTSQYILINVEYPPKLPSVSVSPSEIMEGSSVNLTCSSDANPAANYTWYKENEEQPLGQGSIYNITSISSEDRGIYYCQADNKHGHINSTSQFLDVQYPPKLPSVSVSPSAEIMEGSSVTLTCSSDANPAANYTWYKENEDSPKASGQTFTITNIAAEHSGNYYCEARNTRGHQRFTVHLTVSGSWKAAAAGATTALILLLIFLFVFVLIRKKRDSEQSSDPVQRTDNREQDDLHYASVQFNNNQEESLYSNIMSAQPQKDVENEDEGVVYSAVNFNRSQ